jgi:hypothetical protein
MKQSALRFQISLVAFLFTIALSPESKAGTVFTVSGPIVSGEVSTSVSLSTIEAVGTGTYDITSSLTSLSLTGGSHTITLANLFTFGNYLNNSGFALSVTGGTITGWQFVGFDDSDLTFNPADLGYDGNTAGLCTTFGFGPGKCGIANANFIDIGTGCTALGTASASCTSVTSGGSATSTFSELTITSTPEPGGLLMIGSGLLGLALMMYKRPHRTN